jgi:signal transduction histidine kinase
MNFKAIKFLKGKVVIIVLAFCMLSFSGIIFTVIKSLILDREHLALVEFSKNIEIEVSHSRIKLDDYFLINDTSVNIEILEGLAKAKELVLSLNSINRKDTQFSSKKIIRNFGNILSKIEVHIDNLQVLISNAFLKDKTTIDSQIIKEYNDFQQTFLEFENNLHDYISKRNSNFKGKIFTLLISIFAFLILCLVLIVRLINAYYLVERQYVEKSIEIEYKERKRIAADLHDGLGSILSSIVLFVKLIEKDYSKKNISSNLEQVKQLADMALENLEAAINNLNPSILEKYGLIKSIEILCDKINDIGKVNCTINASNFDMKITKNMEINIYRICNELIHNTLKHANASEIKIDFKSIKKRMYFYYRDNGKGFNPDLISSNKKEKMGLKNMISRVESFDGTYTINSGHGTGVKITLQFNV